MTSSSEFTRDEIEAGRKLFAVAWDFVAAASSDVSLPPMRGVEIAFAGRSNVGKSSLVNALTGRKSLARTSRTPGRTQELIFFTGGSTLNVVDMPGYGYAAAAKSKVAAWTALIGAYLRGRANLARASGGQPPRPQVPTPLYLGSRGRGQLPDRPHQVRRHKGFRTQGPRRGGRSRTGQAAGRLPRRADDLVP